ncbi:MAG TPA: preprotein translocase subunit SecY [Verrucomicrobiales bacterium]|nr:preprotein translocase subunit SecY [Verrucomicrobiales bacterium]
MFSKFFTTIANCFKIPELRARILFTLGVLAICRLIALISVPGLDGAKLKQFFDDLAQNSDGSGNLLGLYSMFTGGALEQCAVGALGIMPYISATIIIQLLTAVVPALSKLAREEGGRPKLIQYGRYLTVILCLGQGLAMAFAWENPGKVFQGFTGDLVMFADSSLWWYRIQTVLILTTGTLLLMWLGEQITERGIGNGVSLVITIGIIARFPQAVQTAVQNFIPQGDNDAEFNIFHAVAFILLLVFVVAFVVAITQAQRKIPVQYAQQTRGRRVFQSGSSFMPLRVIYAGVMPIIFASALLMFPQMILEYLGRTFSKPILIQLGTQLSKGHWPHVILFAVMILFFSYFWVATQFNEVQVADDLKKANGYIPGVRPGKSTAEFLNNTMSRITLAGSVFLIGVAIIPELLYMQWNVDYLVASFFGGTSLLIAVGVMLDTMRQTESHLLMRHYDGFLKKGRLKGRF